jgi:hypothetical protein
VYEKDGKAFAKIIEIKDPKKQNTVCNLCEGDNKGKKNRFKYFNRFREKWQHVI